MNKGDTFSILIKVPDQEFDYIRLIVDHTTTIRQVKYEVIDQLYPGRCTDKGRAIKGIGIADLTEPMLLIQNWTVTRALQSGIREFELIRTDMFQ